MKKHKIILIFSALFIVILCVSLLATCEKVDPINESQVTKIVVWPSGGKEYILSADEVAKFINLYNSSYHEGDAPLDYGSTPEYGARVYFSDGSLMRLSEWEGRIKHFEVSVYEADQSQTAWYYISNKKLDDFVAELIEKTKAGTN